MTVIEFPSARVVRTAEEIEEIDLSPIEPPRVSWGVVSLGHVTGAIEGGRAMRTYTIVIDGEPVTAFRAKDDAEATSFPARLWGEDSPLRDFKPKGEITTRPATVSERQKWTRASIASEEAILDEDDEIERHAAASPDGLLVQLGEDEDE